MRRFLPAILFCAGAAVTVIQPCAAGSPPAVPPSFQDLYTTLSTDLGAFNLTLNTLWNGSKYPVLFSGTLVVANANAGPQLANSGYFTGVQLQLQALKAMGTQAVMVEVGFPMLYEPFLAGQGQNYQDYVNFYQQVAASVRALGMKLIVENNCLLSTDVQAGWNTTAFYATLNWTEYQAARAQTAAIVAQTMQPDYLVVLEEPDTEAKQSGQSNVNTVNGATSMLSEILASVQQSGVSGMKVGAGVGSWLSGFLGFIQSFVTEPVDFIDMHIYPMNNLGTVNFLTNALTIVTTATLAGKPVTMTECWVNKVRNNEMNSLSADVIDARNVYSFWAPLDAYFIHTLENLANYAKMTFVAPSNSDYFWAYQTYNNTTANEPPSQLLTTEAQLAAQATQQAAYTSTGRSYYRSLVSTDTIPPSEPANLTGVSGQPTGAALTWSASTDNVGVAGYYVARNGVKITTTGFTQYQDTGLTGSTTYTYTVEAFDLAGNASPPASVRVTTR